MRTRSIPRVRPIPTEDRAGEVQEKDWSVSASDGPGAGESRSLATSAPGARATVVCITAPTPATAVRLADLGFTPGAVVTGVMLVAGLALLIARRFVNGRIR